MIINTRTEGVVEKPEAMKSSLTRETRSVSVRGIELEFATPNRIARWRVESLLTKEPETVAWLNCFKERDILLDIGANVGMYTIYAAAASKAIVYAFEPESQNYSLLNENIYLNRLDRHVRAFPIAIADRSGMDVLNLSAWGPAGSCHSAGDAIAFNGKKFSPKFIQGTYTLSIDQLAPSLNGSQDIHMKIDVDGIEPLVISGASQSLQARIFKSILIEINHNLDEHIDIVRKMLRNGYVFDPTQVEASLRKEGPFAGVANYVFCRR